MDKIFYNHCSALWHHIEIFIKHEEIYFSEVKISEEVLLIFLRVIFN